ncbi:KAP family P-loop NTPase fold protein [Clostridium folliculivorans]|uniref:KAP family P-loop NTPase fold protein n=1 Tax=Clostridium folliculivorans TaxID=2886038 RepID=UPI0021C406E4|nr:KAP family NTPase [Clostridium folliculivorans]GKU30437.1 hypothetical protein CFB3_25440 [Clostridium folliculivorans]
MAKKFFSDLVSESDYLGYGPYIKTFEYLIENSNELMSLPIVFGLHGEWGTGKSTFMHLTQKVVKDKTFKNGNKKYICLNINPWEYDNDRNFIAVFIAKLYAEAGDLIKDESQDIVNLFKGIIRPLKISLKSIVNVEYDFSKLNFNEQKSEIDRIVSENYLLSKTIEGILGNPVFSDLKIIVFIDDLDRCSIDKVMEVIESIKLVLNSKNCIFFIGCDRNYLERAISVRYEKFFINNIHENKSKLIKSFASEYLEKIIQVPFYIPSLDESSIDNYIERILDGQDDSVEEQTINERNLLYEFKRKLNKSLIIKLITSIGVNPRKIRRILNLLFLSFLFIRFKLEDSAIKDIDLDILSILNIIRDYDHDYYKQYLSNEFLCKEIFEFYHDRNIRKNKGNGIETEIPVFMQVDEINNCFTKFFEELNIKNKNELNKKLKHIAIYISVSNIVTSENYNSSVPDYRSDTATNRNISDFLEKLKKNQQAQKVLTWFFTFVYDKDRFALGINQNIHLYKRDKNGDFNALRDFIFRIEYDIYSDLLFIRFERGKYQCCIGNYEEIMSSDGVKLFDKDRKLIEIRKESTDEELVAIQSILKRLIEQSVSRKIDIIAEVATDGENKDRR